ncbi:MAG: helix-turn-helix transcriptional regulator [Clostridia bacterium]|nr:helix-turn-helix transcriptional regulator [Clostridia bacterium]
MDISSVNSDLIRGNSTTIILGSLWNRDRYGYEIIQEIEEKTEGTYKVKQATLYNQLKKLEKAGLITSYEGAPDDTGGGRRRYYSLTEEGRQLLTKEKSEYVFSRTILDKLISEEEFDFSTPAPFDTDTLRPYTKTGEEAKPKVVYKEKIVEKEIPVEIVKEVVKEVPVEVVKEVEIVREIPVKVVKEVEKEVLKRVYINTDGDEITEQEALLLAEEARQREEEKTRVQHQPVHSLSEMFERLDSQSEYTEKQENYVVAPTPVSNLHEAPVEHTYFTAYASENGSRTRSQATLKEIFDRLEEKENKIENSNVQNAPIYDVPIASDEAPAQQTYRDYAESEVYYTQPQYVEERTYATSAVIGKRDEAFEYEAKEVNYRDFFSSIVSAPEEIKPEPEEKVFTPDRDLKSRLYSEGYKIRPYNRGNTSEYYTFNFISSNRLNRDSWLIIMSLFLVEVAIMWVSLLGRVSFGYFLGFMIGGAALMLIPTVIYISNPTKRIRANFNFKLSIINRSMIFIELLVVCILIGFFAVGASIDNIDMLLQTIILPGVMLTNIPLSSVVYNILYKSRKYHTA